MTIVSEEKFVDELCDKISNILVGKPAAIGVQVIGKMLGQAAAQSHEPDLNKLIEHLYPIAEAEMKDTLESWKEEDRQMSLLS